MRRNWLAFPAVVIIFALALSAQDKKDTVFKLTIIHTNDNHANHEPQASGDGGDARQAAIMKQIRQEVTNHLTIDAGDRFTGTLFHTAYRGMDNVPLLNQLGFQALTIGNHEFDEGDEGLAKFIDQLKMPVLAANVDVSQSNALRGKILPYTIVKVGGQDLGIVGLVTADTKTTSSPSRQVGFDGKYAEVAQRYVDELTMKGVNKVVLLTHIGLSEDLKLAESMRNVDVIVGGHSHTLLSKTYREAKNTYPMRVNDKDGHPVYVVQAGGGDNRFLGRLDLEFDPAGKVIKAGGDTILLSKYVTPDAYTDRIVQAMAKPINELKKRPILDSMGKPIQLRVDLPSNKVRDEETLLGDVMTDAMRTKARTQIALQGGGGLRADLKQGELTLGDIYKLLPFANKLTSFRLKGADLREVLEHGLSRYGESGSGRFLQVAGLRYTFDPTKPKGQRLRSVDVSDGKGGWVALDPEGIYSVASDSFIRNGGDDFTILRDRAIDPNEDLPPIQDVLIEYLRENPRLEPRLEGRIRILKSTP